MKEILSGAFQFNALDLWKVLRTYLLSLAAVLLVAASGWATSTDFGPLGPILIVPAITSLIDAARRYITDNAAKVDQVSGNVTK